MGYGNYSHDAHQAIAHQRANLPQQQVFKQQNCHPLMDPKGVRARTRVSRQRSPPAIACRRIRVGRDRIDGGNTRTTARKELPDFMRIMGDCNAKTP